MEKTTLPIKKFWVRACIEVMKDYKIHPKVIDATAEIYEGDTTKINIGYDLETELDITSGIKQGCTGSTTYIEAN